MANMIAVGSFQLNCIEVSCVGRVFSGCAGRLPGAGCAGPGGSSHGHELCIAACGGGIGADGLLVEQRGQVIAAARMQLVAVAAFHAHQRSEEHTSELQSPCNLVCRLLLEKKKKKEQDVISTENTD